MPTKTNTTRKKSTTKTSLNAEIKKDLLDQLQRLGKTGTHFTDLVEDYMFYWGLKDKLRKDINGNGLRYDTVNGNGFTQQKPNESVQNIMKVTAQMLKILSELGLQDPEVKSKKAVSENAYM